MKNKWMFAMFVAVGMLLATSCSSEEEFVAPVGEAKVRFSLGLEKGMNTRAVSDGTVVNELIYAIFDSEGNRVAESDASAEFPFEKTVHLLKGEEYTAVFWAQSKDCDAYTISDDYTTIIVDYASALNNDENRDAFFNTETFTATEDANISVVLKRALAQINLGITEEEWLNAKNAGFEVTKSKVELKKAATTMNLLDGSVGGAEDVTFAYNDIISGELLAVDTNGDGVAENYKYLSMCYILANDAVTGSSQTTLDELKFTLSSADGTKIMEVKDGLANAPVQRNHRTNIVSSGISTSSILTNGVEVKLLLDPLYDGEHTLGPEYTWERYDGIYTEEALAGKTIELPAGWHIRNGYILQPMPENWTATSSPLYAKPYTIDGKNNTVKFEPYGYKFVTKNAFAAADSQLVTIKNIIFEGEHFGVFGGVFGGVSGRTKYKTLFENVSVVNNGIYCYNDAGSIPMSAFSNLGEATLDNCTIKGTYWVGSKDLNTYGQAAYDNYGIYDIFVPNSNLTHLKNSTVGTIYINNHGNLKISGTSVVDRVYAPAIVKATITIESGAKVKLLDAEHYSASYAPVIDIKAGATIETLQLNSIAKTSKITIEAGASINKIIHKGVEYSSIADFKNSLL